MRAANTSTPRRAPTLGSRAAGSIFSSIDRHTRRGAYLMCSGHHASPLLTGKREEWRDNVSAGGRRSQQAKPPKGAVAVRIDRAG